VSKIDMRFTGPLAPWRPGIVLAAICS
jgi:hypothetical protein